MPRSFTEYAVGDSFATETGNVWLILLEVNHTSLGTPHYLVNDTLEIESGGITYTPYPFEIILSDDDGERLPEVSLTIDNVHRDLVEIVRTMLEPPEITVKLVLSSDPDTVELTLSNLVLRNVDWDAYTLKGILYSDDILNQRYPEGTMSLSAGYLGLFV